MTQEEKAKAYDKVVNKLRHFIVQGVDPLITRYDVQDFFPELAESEDDSIRKELSKDIWNYIPYEKAQKYITWLKKQDKPKDKSVLEVWKDMRLEVYQQASGNRHEANYSDDTTKMFSLNDIDEIIEKMSEQKSADKAEPKFHEGEWAVSNLDKKARQISEVHFDEYNSYYVVDGKSVNLEEYDRLHHLWSIADAKDGDVLCYKDEISLYKHDIKNCTKQEITFGGFVYHCCYDGKRFITDSLYSLTEQDKIDIHPATNEQRELLFAKMREAGYEWNEEKKDIT